MCEYVGLCITTQFHNYNDFSFKTGGHDVFAVGFGIPPGAEK